MNTRRGFEIRLGLKQVAVGLGLVAGCLLCSFYLGFFSGRSVGVQTALESSAAQVVKLPIVPPLNDERVEAEVAHDVYARLTSSKIQSAHVEPTVALKGKKPVEPEIVSIPELTEEQLKDDGELGSLLPPVENKTEEEIVAAEVDTTIGSSAPVPTVAPTATSVPTKIPTPANTPAPKATPKVTPTPVVSAVSSKNILPKGWYAQISAPEDVNQAQQMAKKLKSAGFPVQIESASVNGKRYYRVVVGPETTKSTADRLLDQLKREPGVGSPFLRAVK